VQTNTDVFFKVARLVFGGAGEDDEDHDDHERR
jgi:hypothetical protein